MKLAAVLPFVSLAFAHDTIRPGTMYISKMWDHPVYQDLMIHGDKLSVGAELATFDFNEGSLKLSGSERYLSVNQDGKLILDEKPYTGFSLATQDGFDYKRTLQLGNDDDFELCWDNLIGYNSSCHEARKVTITYEDIVQPR